MGSLPFFLLLSQLAQAQVRFLVILYSLLSQLAQAQVRGHCHSLFFCVSWHMLRCWVIVILYSFESAGTGSGAGSFPFFTLLSQQAQAQVRGHCHSLLFRVSWQRLRCGVIVILYSLESAGTGSGAGSLVLRQNVA